MVANIERFGKSQANNKSEFGINPEDSHLCRQCGVNWCRMECSYSRSSSRYRIYLSRWSVAGQGGAGTGGMSKEV